MNKVVAYQIGSYLDLKLCTDILSLDPLFEDSDEVFYQKNEGEFIYAFQFGMISFFGISNQEIQTIISKLKRACKQYFDEKLKEELEVEINNANILVKFNKVIIPEINPEIIRLVMLYTSQSVALNRYGEITEKLIAETTKYTKYLELHGKLNISGNNLKKFIGRVLNIKNGILENLYIFDSPDIIWEDELLNQLDQKLKVTFDLKDRYRRLSHRIEIIKENLELFKDIMDHNESKKLEWIIILLILVEVIDMFIIKLM
ncbi:RMD1 family protein [Pseudofulvibacter geojedonensis]|uniref:RMD1 family protein n=1 Tax=Pseudofulvibacter geojedonensis TaxID=1123758 RepID=A0ABW3I2G4_9FLAO